MRLFRLDPGSYLTNFHYKSQARCNNPQTTPNKKLGPQPRVKKTSQNGGAYPFVQHTTGHYLIREEGSTLNITYELNFGSTQGDEERDTHRENVTLGHKVLRPYGVAKGVELGVLWSYNHMVFHGNGFLDALILRRVDQILLYLEGDH